MSFNIFLFVSIVFTVKPVLRDHLLDKPKVVLDSWPLKWGLIHTNFSMTGQEKSDLLIQMTSWAGLTVFKINYFYSFNLIYNYSTLFRLEAQWAEPVSLTFHSALRKFNTEPSIGASHQISVHFDKAVSDKKIFRNWPI